MEKEMLKQELVHLEEIQDKIRTELTKQQQFLEKQREDVIQERREMWQEGAHNVMDFDDIIDMASYDEKVREAFGHYVRIENEVRQLSYLQKNPYFGRVDFAEDGGDQAEKIYIGRYGLFDKKTYECVIYDWRTPVASMFYDCTMGDASYQCPAGEIQGEITLKRQYRIEEGILKYCYDTNMAVRDELLGKVLSENTDKVLRVIIDTITREQNQAIRHSHSMNLLVTGPAGSGKTSVGMHRLAYLLYHNRDNLTSEKIVVMSRNQIFSSYISGILPELGEENVNDVTFDSLINGGISGFDRKGYYEQADYLLKYTGETMRSLAIGLKYSANFLEYIRESLKHYRGGKNDFEAALEIYLELLKRYRVESSESVYLHTRANFEREQLYYEDFLLVSYIRILIRGIRPMDQISHVVLDEAQDYCRVQLYILKLMYPKSRFTVLADINQIVSPQLSTVDVEEFRQILGKDMKKIALSKSYRSTAPINRFAFQLIGIQNSDLYVDRPGKEPEQIMTGDKASTVINLLRQIPSDKSVAILTSDKKAAWEVKMALGNTLSQTERKLQYILKQDQWLEEKVVVMPIMLAKGLEFDVVIVWDDKSESYWQVHKNLKYLMCTRALHELYFVTEDKMIE